jgi:hypothetical protein
MTNEFFKRHGIMTYHESTITVSGQDFKVNYKKDGRDYDLFKIDGHKDIDDIYSQYFITKCLEQIEILHEEERRGSAEYAAEMRSDESRNN